MPKASAAARCASCRTPLESLGPIPVRTGGASGGWIFFFGEWAQATEKLLPLDTYRCGTCGRLEFFDHDRSLPKR